jgi:hypothetical protein
VPRWLKRDKDFKISFRTRSKRSGTASTCLSVFAKICIAPESLLPSREVGSVEAQEPDSAPVSQAWSSPARVGTRRADGGFLHATIAVTSRCLTGATSAGANRLRPIPVEPGFFRIADGAHPEAFPRATVWSVYGGVQRPSHIQCVSATPPWRMGSATHFRARACALP